MAIKEITVKFKGSASQFSGAVVLGEWTQQKSFSNNDCANNSVVIKVTNPQNTLTVYKWWPDSTFEIADIELRY